MTTSSPTAHPALDWWRTAPNPTCAKFCDEPHPDDDYAKNGGMLCCRDVADVPQVFRVEVQQFIGLTKDELGPQRYQATIRVEVMSEFIDPDFAEALAGAIVTAGNLAREQGNS